MKSIRVEHDLYDLPELEETDFTPTFRPRAWIEDSNDIGEMGDAFSISLDTTDMGETFAFDA